MRLYFISCAIAQLRIDGVCVGVIDKFERFTEVAKGSPVLIEAVPDGEYMPVNFFISEKLFKSPPQFLKVFMLGEEEAVLEICFYERREKPFYVISQLNLDGALITLFTEGGRVYVSGEGYTCNLYPLPPQFLKGRLSKISVGGLTAAAVEGEGMLCVLSGEGRRVFFNTVTDWRAGETLDLTVPFFTCAEYFAECSYSYDGREMRLVGSVTRAKREVNAEILPFAFFECVLIGGDYAEFLSGNLKENADKLRGFLGDFTAVTVPHSSFYKRHGDIWAAGLAYPINDNLFKIKYFAVELSCGKVENIYEVQ